MSGRVNWTLEYNLHIYNAPVSIVTVMHADRESESYVWPICPKSLFIAHKKMCVLFQLTIRNVPEKAPTIHTHIHLAQNVQYGHCYGRQQKWNNPNNNKGESRVMSFYFIQYFYVSHTIHSCHSSVGVISITFK